MAVKGGRHEAIITVPTGGWDMAVTGTGSGTATIPAGSYYLNSGVGGGNSLLTEIKNQLSSVTGDVHTATLDDGEGDVTGRCTLTSDGGTFAITWTDTELRDILGFASDGNLSGSTSYTSTDHAKMMFAPGVPVLSEFGAQDSGRPISNTRQSMSPTGAVKSAGSSAIRHEQRFRYNGVPHKRTRIAGEGAGQANMSFEQFWTDALQGQLSGATRGGRCRYYWDADVDGTYYEYYAIGKVMQTFAPTMTSEGLTSYWSFEIETSKAPT